MEISQDSAKPAIIDPSDAGTIKSIENFECKILEQKVTGYGNALIEGIKNVNTKYFCIFNADGSFDPKDLEKMTNRLEDGEDFIFASRKLTIPAFVATFVTTWYGGILEVGRFTFENGIITWIIFGLFYYISAFILLKYIAPKIHFNNIGTIPEYFHKHFDYI